MHMYFKVIDEQPPLVQNYFSLVFKRSDRVKQDISISRWVWLCFVEILFGQELLESFVNTASNSGCPEDPDLDREYGEPIQLNLHIPAGIFTKIFRSHLLQVLYYKFYLQYLFILPTSEPFKDEIVKIIDVTRNRFRLRKSLLYLVIPFRRVYILTAIMFNFIADALTYAVTTNLSITIAVAAFLEFLRRLLRL